MDPKVTRRGILQAALAAELAAGAVAAAASEAPPTRRASFDEGWTFSQGDFPGAEANGFADDSWAGVDLPHDWSIAGPYDEQAPTGGSGGYLPTGIGWYRKRFTLPASTTGKRVAIVFDGIYQRSEVWINGHSLGMRPYGFVSFTYDLTPFLNPAGQPNLIAVRVDNSLQPNSRWYSGSGIYRHAWLMVTDPVHLALWGSFVRGSDVSSLVATIDVSAKVSNAGTSSASCSLRAAILDASGATITMTDTHASVRAGADHVFEQRFRVANPALWSLETRNLYTLRTTLYRDGQVCDEETTPFGIRDARFDVDNGFMLNGARVKLNGVCLHADGGAVGAAVPAQVWERRLELLKEMGCNAIRTSHHPPAPEFLDLCDRMGFLVMDEAFDEWRQPKVQTPNHGYHQYFDEWWQRDVTAMITRDRNHPCVVIWSAGNEIGDQTDPRGPQTLQALLDVMHAEDPTRPITAACDNIAAEPHATPDAFLNKLDVVGYNYVDRWRDRREKYYSIDRHDHPRWRFIGTESTALGGVRGDNDFISDEPVFFERANNRRIATEQLQKFIQTYEYVSGDFIWTGIDYLGESRWPSKLASSGALDTCGFRKSSYYFYQSIWTKAPMLHAATHWNWAGREGQIIPVSCYTNCDTVELFLNGKSLGVKGYAFPRPGMITRWPIYPPRANAVQTTADLHLAWDVPYVPGVLRAVATKDGAVVATQEVRTAGEPAALRLTADRTRIGAQRDIAHVTVEVLDSDGVFVPLANNDIAFDLQGVGKILAVDNGQPDSHESYQAPRRKAFNGMALVLLQSAGAGVMTLNATSPSLRGARLSVEASNS
ncbi:MAG: glycoside hydrolase family 2 TIM barrel-domain containing protein [Pseudomonadota bacterium]